MGWRTVVISNPARLRVEQYQLVIAQEEETPLPLEDIDTLLIESPEVTLTSALLYRLAQAGAMVLVCDDKHLPNFAGLPFAGHSRLAGAQRLQLSMSLPFKKRCWQAVVRQKVANQAECLTLAGRAGVEKLRGLLPFIASGDTGNVEARAARYYFTSLFGQDFLREDLSTVNIALNYGYAVVRASVARALAAHGFLLSQGIHHRSELNAFNLADDFIEPLRPIVDLCVAQSVTIDTVFDPDLRRTLVSLLAQEVLIDEKRHGINRAVEIMAASFVSACRDKSAGSLKLPELLPPRVHSYE